LNWKIYLVLLPTLVVLGALAYYPSISGIWHSLYDWRPGYDSPFVGLDNYRAMLHDDLWWSSFRNLGIIFVASVTVMWVMPVIAAELVISLRSARLQHVFRILLIVPLAFPGVVTALVWSFMYDPNDGVINRFLRSVGLGSWAHNWVGDPNTALGALLAIGFPWVAGLPFLVMLATLQNIPTEVFEAAELDGAGRLRRLVHIDLPLMARQFKLLIFLAIVSTLHYGLAAYLVTSGGPDNSTQVPVLWIIGSAFQGQQWGYAAALSTTLFVITFVASGILLFTRRKGQLDDVRAF
jgi:raffinose/stachyose/melibiose transport system permease protein